jgi:hypothetical protein
LILSTAFCTKSCNCFELKKSKFDKFTQLSFFLNLSKISKSGNNKHILQQVHPDLIYDQERNPKPKKAPELDGYKFETIFEYTMYKLATNRLVFSTPVSYNEKGEKQYNFTFMANSFFEVLGENASLGAYEKNSTPIRRIIARGIEDFSSIGVLSLF